MTASESSGTGTGSTAGFRRAGLIVLAGSAAGFGINLLLTPVLSRLFSPDRFGFFSTITAVTSVFVGVSTFRLEVLSQRTPDDAEAAQLRRLGLVMASAWGLALTIVAAAWMLVGNVSAWWLAAGVLVTIASLQLIGSAGLTRTRSYRALAISNFVQGAGTGAVQIVLGWLVGGAGSLLAGFGAARLVWLRSTRIKGHAEEGLRQLWQRSRRFAAVSGGSALINSLAGQLPILLSTTLFGHAEAGYLAMAVRILVAPLGIVSQAAASANIGEVGNMLREGSPDAPRVVVRSMRDLLLLGVIPCVAVGGLAIWLVPVVLGSTWAPTGTIMAVLAIGSLAQFVGSPFSQLLNLTGHNRRLLAWDVSRLLLIGISFGVVGRLAGLIAAVAAYSGILVVLYALLIAIVVSAVRAPRG